MFSFLITRSTLYVISVFLFTLTINISCLKGLNYKLDSIVTNEVTGGRLGDQLISYMHAKWVSYKYNLPIYYKKFPYSDQLILDDVEFHYNNYLIDKLKKRVMQVGDKLDNFITTNNRNTLYEIPYFPESLEEFQPTRGPENYQWHRKINTYAYFAVDWNDPIFKKIIQTMVAPKKPLTLVKLPKNKFTIALQVRKNSNGFDLPLLHNLSDQAYNPKTIYVDVVFPFKHPPEEYFIEQLKYVIKRFNDKDLYVYVFTDDLNPTIIVDRIKQAINNSKIEFACRDTSNNHYSNVLEDLFSIAQFDCFIRPDSNLGIVASKLGNFKMVISPAHHKWKKHKLIIDEVGIQENM